MGIFGTSKADLIKEVAKTGALLTAALNDLQIERTQHGHTKAELARLTTRGPGGRFVKVDVLAGRAKPNGTPAAVQGVA